MIKQKTSTVMMWVPLVALLACDPEDGVHDRNLVIAPGGTSDGGDDGGDEGSDEADEAWDVGEVQICEVVVVGAEHQQANLEVEDDGLNLAADEAADEEAEFSELDAELDALTDAPDVAAGPVACPMSGTSAVTYVDYTCTAGDLTCKHYCECEASYTSPCNPPHADCGGLAHKSTPITNSWTFSSQLACNTTGWAFCRKQTGLSAIKSCTSWCQNNMGRTVNCPDCAANN